MIVARLTPPLYLQSNQHLCLYESPDVLYPRFSEPFSDHGQDLRIRLGCIIETGGIYKDYRVVGGGMVYSDGSNIRCVRP
jgi:hypothetical protein